MQLPSVQSKAARYAVEKIPMGLDGSIEIDRLAIVFYNRILIFNAALKDPQGDTVASFRKLSLTFRPFKILRGNLGVENLSIDGADFRLITVNEERFTSLNHALGVYERKPKSDEPKPIGIPPMTIKSLRLKDAHVVLRNPYSRNFGSKEGTGCIDFADMDIRDINLQITNIVWDKKTLECRIRNLEAMDKSGWGVRRLTTDVSIGAKVLVLNNPIIEDNYTHIDASRISFGYNRGRDISQFCEKIILDCWFNEGSRFDFRTLGRISPSLNKSKLALNLQGHVNGPVADLHSTGLEVSTDYGTSLLLATDLTGLPKIRNSDFNLSIKNLSTTFEGLAGAIADFTGGKPIAFLERAGKGMVFNYDVEAKGSWKDFQLNGTLSRDGQSLHHELKVNNPSVPTVGLGVKGRLQTTDFPIGSILAKDILSELTMDTDLDLRMRKKQYGGIKARIDSLNISRIGFKGYDYTGLSAHCEMDSSIVDFRLLSRDTSAMLMAQAILDMSQQGHTGIKAYLTTPGIDLQATKLTKSSDSAVVTLSAHADVVIDKEDGILGSATIKDFGYRNIEGANNLGDLFLLSSFDQGLYTIDLESPVADLKYSGDTPPMPFVKRLKNLVAGFLPEFIKKSPVEEDEENGNCRLDLTTRSLIQLFDIFAPDFYIAAGTNMSLALSDQDSLDLVLKSNRLAHKGKYLRGVSLKCSNSDTSLKCIFRTDTIHLGNMRADNNRLDLHLHPSHIDLGLGFYNDDEQISSADFKSKLHFERDSRNILTTSIHIDSSNVTLKDTVWRIPPSDILFRKKDIRIDSLRILGRDEYLMADGKLSALAGDTMDVVLKNFRLAVLNPFSKKNAEFSGVLNGNARVTQFFSTPDIRALFTGSGLKAFGKDIDSLFIKSEIDPESQNLGIIAENIKPDCKPFSISGYYSPKRKFIKLNASLDQFSMAYLSPILENVMDIRSGSLSGNVSIEGPFKKLAIKSDDCVFKDFTFVPVVTRVPYILNGPIILDERSINVSQITFADTLGHQASLSGAVRHRYFKNIRLDTKLNFSNLMCLNTTIKDNSSFFGRVFGSGEIGLSGPPSELGIDVRFKTEDNTSIHIPLSNSLSARTSDLITYKVIYDEDADPYEILMAARNASNAKKKRSRLTLRANAEINRDAELVVDIQKEMGSVAKIRGNGDIGVTLIPHKNLLDLKGDFTVSEGNCHISILGITGKDFTIDEGGNVTFNGELRRTALNAGASYHTKASVSTLIADTTSVGQRRNVSCGVTLSGTLESPRLGFKIDIPDLDPITKGRVESALSTADKIQKQFMALLISGSFVPDEQGGIINDNNILFSNASEILSNQVNNIFRQLEIPLDMGLNYSRDQSGRDLFDVAISYQALNNRLIINGSVGNSHLNNNWKGDLSVEYKVDQKGKLRVSVFTKSSDSYTNFLDNSQRHGIGVNFQDEFNTFGEFWRNIFLSKKKRKEWELKLMEDAERELRERAAEAGVSKSGTKKNRTRGRGRNKASETAEETEDEDTEE